MNLSTALYQLRHQPVEFLKHNLVSIAGYNQSMSLPYFFGYHDNYAAGAGTNEGFKFSHNQVMVRSQRAGNDGKSTTAILVHNVRMIGTGEDLDVSNIPGYVLNGAGPDIMVTGQLSGCIFAIKQGGGGLVVAHIQPCNKRQAGHMLRETIRLMGRFSGNGRVTKVFGVGKDYQQRAHVIGVRSGGAWHIYAQKVQGGNGPVTGAVQIV